MFPIKKILFTLLGFGLVYFSLYSLVFFTPMREDLAAGFRKTTHSYVSMLFPKATFRVKRGDTKLDPEKVKISFVNQAEVDRLIEQARREGKSRVSMKSPAVLLMDVATSLTIPMMFLWALVLAGPLGWRNKLLAFLLGTLLFLLYLAVRIYIVVHAGIASTHIGIYEMSDFWTGIYLTLSKGMSMSINILVAVVIWILVGFQRSNWQRVLG